MLENATVNDFTVLTSEYNVKKYFLLKLTRGIRKKRGSSRVSTSEFNTVPPSSPLLINVNCGLQGFLYGLLPCRLKQWLIFRS